MEAATRQYADELPPAKPNEQCMECGRRKPDDEKGWIVAVGFVGNMAAGDVQAFTRIAYCPECYEKRNYAAGEIGYI